MMVEAARVYPPILIRRYSTVASIWYGFAGHEQPDTGMAYCCCGGLIRTCQRIPLMSNFE